MLKILITADIHLGINEAQSGIPSSVRMETFRRICSLAIEHDVLLIAGDLFDLSGDDDPAIAEVARGINTLASSGVMTFFLPGKNDMLEGVVPSSVSSMKFTHIFSGDTAPCHFEKNGESIYLYGVKNGEIGNITKIADEGVHIGLIYSSSDVFSFKKDINNKLVLDFFILGSGHSSRMFKYQNQVIGVCPGSPEACSLEETGERFVYSMPIDGGKIASIKRLTVNTLLIKKKDMDLTGIGREKFINLMTEERNKNCLLILSLIGERSFFMDEKTRSEISSLFYRMVVEDSSKMSLSYFKNDIERKDSVFINFVDFLSRRVAGDGVDETLLVELLGTLGLDEKDITEEWVCGFFKA